MTVILWICAIAIAIIVAVLASWLGPLILEEIYERRMKRDEPPTFHVAPSPLLGRTPWEPEPEPAPVLLAGAHHGHTARLEQQARHANVVTAASPDTASETTQEFNQIAERTTGRPPRRRGPREATLPPVRLRWEPGQQWPGTPEPLWQQAELFEVGR